jgi:hypothetical protein
MFSVAVSTQLLHTGSYDFESSNYCKEWCYSESIAEFLVALMLTAESEYLVIKVGIRGCQFEEF